MICMIGVFYHVFQHGRWEDVFREQYAALMFSGLGWKADHVHIGINGSEKIFIPIKNFHIEYNLNLHMEESDTLLSLSRFADQHVNAKILYTHTKGITRYPNTNTDDWRRLMQYFCVERWRECIDLLDDHDALGCNLGVSHDWGPNPHFSGNFWWANASYINRLNSSYLKDSNRYMREFWIGSGGGDLYELHKSGVDHYKEPYHERLYKNA